MNLPKLKIQFLSFVVLLCFMLNPVKGQKNDSDTIRHHSPRKAMIMSAIIPGLGQVYNNKVWKLPLLYGGAGAAIYYLNYNQLRFDEVRSIRKREITEPYYQVYERRIDARQLERAQNYFGRYRDISMFSLIGVYVLNILDANVDAYMFEYDISDDLSMELRPAIIPSDFQANNFGLKFSLRF
jgi:hypothetical protein